MAITSFDDIRPFIREELPRAFERLLEDTQFQHVASIALPDTPFEELAEKILSCKDSSDFQKKIGYHFIEHILTQQAAKVEVDFKDIDIVNQRHTFISNHRDIVLDSAILAKLLFDHGSPTTCEIAIGDNLLSLPWVKDLVRINKSFIVHRSLPPREMLQASRTLAQYIHHVINTKDDNVWIAQREGRAKNSDDRTQPALIKMLCMADRTNTPAQTLKELHIAPLAISYEYDPCDYLKAREMQLRRDDPSWRKSAEDDVLSMRTGLTGYKGRIAYNCSTCLDNMLKQMDKEYTTDTLSPLATKNNKLYERVAAETDRLIHQSYTIFPNNAIALHWLSEMDSDFLPWQEVFENSTETPEFGCNEEDTFREYLHKQIARIDLPCKDEPFLMRQLLIMYAFPLINKLRQSHKS